MISEGVTVVGLLLSLSALMLISVWRGWTVPRPQHMDRVADLNARIADLTAQRDDYRAAWTAEAKRADEAVAMARALTEASRAGVDVMHAIKRIASGEEDQQ